MAQRNLCGVRGLLKILSATKGKIIGCHNLPLCVAIHKEGGVYVGSSAGSIDVYKDFGGFHERSKIISIKGSIDQHDPLPYGIFIKEDVVYVADHCNNRILKLTLKGECLQQFGTFGSGQGQMDGPAAVIADSNNRLFVSDFSNHRIQVFDEDGTWRLSINGKESGDKSFINPWGLALDPEGNIHVAAYRSRCIKVFDSTGVYIRTYGGDLEKPIGVAVNSEGYSVVSEGEGNCLTLFDPQGEKVHTVGGFTDPWGVALDPRDGSVYVANRWGQTILKY